jgi:radical SAM superfamily enzyme YgiQ (UPF0313 family)
MMPAFNMAYNIVPPLGPAYIAGALRAEGVDVTFLDAVGLSIEQYTTVEHGILHGLTLEQLVAKIPEDADMIGVAIQFSYEWPTARDLLKLIRARFPEVLLIAGGEHATAVPELCLHDSPLDAVVLGEGEESVCELARAYKKEGIEGLKQVAGLHLKDGPTAHGERIREIDKIPRPAWDLIPIEEYLSRRYGFGVDRGRSMPVLASRGCPYQCTFCSNPFMWTTRWIARDIDDLLNELATLQKTYDISNFDFYDLTVIVKRQWIVDFCRAIESRGMKFTWQLPSGTRSEAIDPEVSGLLYKTGCRNISYAPESGSEESLTKIKKKVSMPMMLRSMRGAVLSGLNTKANFIFGFPHENWSHIRADVWLMVKMAVVGVHDISIWTFVPYPGSELFFQLKKEGKIKELDDEYFYGLAAYSDITKTHSFAPALSKTGMLWARGIAILFFYAVSWTIRPWRLLRMIWNFASGHFESRSEQALRGLFDRGYKWLSKPTLATKA